MGRKRSRPTNRPKSKSQSAAQASDHNFRLGTSRLYGHPMFSSMMYHVGFYRHKDNLCPPDGWAVVTSNGHVHAHPTRLGEPEEWAYVLAHCLLHLGLGHFKEAESPDVWNIACDHVVASFLQEFRFGTPPEPMNTPIDGSVRDEEKVYRQLRKSNIPEHLWHYSTAGLYTVDMIFEQPIQYYHSKPPDWHVLFAQGLASAVTGAVAIAGGEADDLFGYYDADDGSMSGKARKWFMNHFPLLGGLAAGFKIIEDNQLCTRMDISVAAVNPSVGEIYMKPAAFHLFEEYIFVMAHELLHVALRHEARRQGRDPYFWNVACDYVINEWLVEMNVGQMPSYGVLYDPELKGLNAEAVYDLIVNDLRKYRKLATLKGRGQCDILDGPSADWWKTGEGLRLDEFYRRALQNGYQYTEMHGRGFLPAGLIEEIRALLQPPIPWDVELAQWFDAQFPPLEKVRSYARPSRRQSSTPDIPRPRYVLQETDLMDRTFGVVLDTSGSMDRTLLAKALGAIASYCMSRDVMAARVVFCDAHPYDEGYMAPEDIAGRVRVKGRGGTILMPGIRLLENADDFPADGPILIITDTECDRITVQQPREYAFLIPAGKHLPFPTTGKVFKIGD
ncbi:MAG: peptidase [Chloroflexi bacterium]|nr:peptidase [Chloroflexota bacterium]